MTLGSESKSPIQQKINTVNGFLTDKEGTGMIVGFGWGAKLSHSMSKLLQL